MVNTGNTEASERRPRRARYALLAAVAVAATTVTMFAAAASASAAPAPIPLESSSCPVYITQGEVDGCVTQLQTLLNNNGAGLGVDGDFGPATFTAVENYQGSHGLGVDGIVGPATKSSLDGGTSTGNSTNYDFATVVLQDGGWPVTGENLTVFTQWMASENPVSNWWNRNNPLNNGLGSGGGGGLGSYPDLLTAASYVAQNIHGGLYPSVDADLAASAPVSTTVTDIWNSPWAESHYGNGANWFSGTADTVAAPASAW